MTVRAATFRPSNSQHEAVMPSLRWGVWRSATIPSVSITMVIVMAVAMVLYVVLVNDLSTKVYEVRALRAQLTELTAQTLQLEQSVALEQSRVVVINRLRSSRFVPEGVLEYARSSAVAFGGSPQP